MVFSSLGFKVPKQLPLPREAKALFRVKDKKHV
jgi:hypothetical protein